MIETDELGTKHLVLPSDWRPRARAADPRKRHDPFKVAAQIYATTRPMHLGPLLARRLSRSVDHAKPGADRAVFITATRDGLHRLARLTEDLDLPLFLRY